MDDVNKLIQTIQRLEASMLRRTDSGKIELMPPAVLSETIAKIAVLLANGNDMLTNVELEYRQAKAAKYDTLLKEIGENGKAKYSRSGASDAMDYDTEIIEHKMAVERIKGFVKRTDNVISTIQSHIRTATAMER